MRQSNGNPERAAFAADPGRSETILGVVDNVDVVQRELSIHVGSRQILVDVPPECAITLRGELIKLRLVQPGDVVRINLIQRSDSSAERIEVAGRFFAGSEQKVTAPW